MISYRPLFRVNLPHDYFLSRGDVVLEAQPTADQATVTGLYDFNDILDIFPDELTQSRLSGYKMIFRTDAAGFTVAVKLDPTAADTRPAIPLAADLNLTFAIRPTDARFGNYTELGTQTTGFYRFGNDSTNEVAGQCFLSRAIPAFDATRKYGAGDVYSVASGTTFNLFVAIRDTGPSATPTAADWRQTSPDTFSTTATYATGAIVLSNNTLYQALVNAPGTDLTNATNWKPIGTLANQYVSSADALTLIGSLFAWDISSAALPSATVRLYKGATLVSEQSFSVPQGTLSQVPLDLRNVPSGVYRLELRNAAMAVIPATPTTVYLSQTALNEGWWGVIEIGLGAADFALLNGDGTLHAPSYTLRFLNRATRWRYIFPAAQSVGTGAEVAVDGTDNTTLVTGGVRALTRFGTGALLRADDPATATVSEQVLLPLPEVDLIRLQNTQWYSETRVPNITLGP